ncbi:DUF6600 domain-containing protein [Rugamonas sp.]|uniref:DUF6600 domain-containing protein n=1 Tax=Rugamonas sp. TaxID=1926287 RepID=UPI0025F9F5B9|nr:DUF6600 domain-containing protein [Rugamonas sp.]
MTPTALPQRTLTALCVAAALGLMSAPALADPSTRVARLAYADGAVSFSPAGDNSWLQAPLNRPLASGDRVWADSGARDELQVGGAAVRMDGGSLLTLLNVSDNTTQLQLSQGRVVLRVGHLDPDQVMEIDTPNLAFTIRRPGHYRIDVDAAGNTTAVTVGEGQGQAYGEGNTYLIDAGQSYRFGGTDLHNYTVTTVGAPDEFDRWATARDRRLVHSQAVRYVSPDVVGYQDLDDAGSWRTVPEYGPVWTPSHVASNWAPYHDGHWAWVDPWGWTWVDDQPWGFAVTHYGRWTNIQGSWGWVPGPIHERPVYAPALVAFVGGAALLLSERPGSHGVAWFPLAPREVYRPAYHVSQNYFTHINASNTVINRTEITNVYNNNVTNINYVNRGVRGAVTAVPTATFVHAQPVGRAAVALSSQMLAHAPVVAGAAIAPQRDSLGEQRQGHRPAEALLTRPAIVKTAPPAPPPSFASRQPALAASAGRPLDAEAMARLHGAPAQAAPPFHMAHAPDHAPAGHPPAPAAAAPLANTVAPLPNTAAMQHPPHEQRPAVAAPPHQLDQQSMQQQAQAAHHDNGAHRDQPPHPVAAFTPQADHAPGITPQQQAPQPEPQQQQQQQQQRLAQQHVQEQQRAQEQQHVQTQPHEQLHEQQHAQEQQHRQEQQHQQEQQHPAQAKAQEQHAPPPKPQAQAEHREPPQQMAQAKPQPEHHPQQEAKPQPPHPHEGGGNEHRKEEEKH